MNKKVLIIVGVLVVLLGGAGGYVLTQNNDKSEKKEEKSTIAPNNPSSDTTSASLVVKEEAGVDTEKPEEVKVSSELNDKETDDGASKIDRSQLDSASGEEVSDTPNTTSETLEKSITYNVPKGRQSKINLIIATTNGVIDSVEFDFPNADPESSEYHEIFENDFAKNKIIGSKIDDVEDVFVSGASLTSKAFNQAINQL